MTDRYIVRSGRPVRVIVARVKPGSDLLRSLQKVAAEEGITSGVIVSGVGLLKQARLRNCKRLPDEYPITDANRTYLSFEKPLEILSISGNVTLAEGEPLVHAHLTLSKVEGDEITVIGGHLIEGCVVFGFSEFAILELEGIEMVKRFDEETQTLQLFE
ncbi:DNA-binding protein [Candidatus Bathyarchaeota archaeon]|nr:DNA-binding protein [Candidatus Bathyarchaeota archaeon]